MQTRKIKNSPKGNDTENKLHQMLYDYLAITVGVVIERAHRVKKKQYKFKQVSRAIVAKLLNYKDKEHTLYSCENIRNSLLEAVWQN